jgi:nitrite reductase/ring-hydroxylating ferredoxin subunit
LQDLPSDLNHNTQPIGKLKHFNNWDFVSKGWYVACKSSELKTKKPLSKKICNHQIVLFRTESGVARALDAFCPHMGMNLAKEGKVIGDNIRCFFHHWKFSGDGECVDIPCVHGNQNEAHKKRMKTQAYPVEEKYGLVWVFSDHKAPHDVFEIPDLVGKEVMYTHLAPFKRASHPHITMMNSIDEQHMRTVHKLSLSLNSDIKQENTRFGLVFEGPVLTDNIIGKFHKFLFGDRYSSSVLFEDGCIGLLTTGIKMKLFGRWQLPKGYFIFSHTFVERGKNEVHPIIVTERRKGLLGFLFSWTYLRFNKLCMKYLAHQDGRIIYGNLRFNPAGLLPEADGPSAKWINFVNRVLEPSLWSSYKAPSSTDSQSDDEQSSQNATETDSNQSSTSTIS